MSEINEKMKLVKSYFDDIAKIDMSNISYEVSMRMLDTLKKVNKHINDILSVDPKAVLVVEGEDGYEWKYLVSDFQGDALIYEAVAKHDGKNQRSSLVGILEKAINSFSDNAYGVLRAARAYYLLSLVYAEMGLKEKSISSIKKAIDLDPDEFDYKKQYDEISGTSGAIIAAQSFRGSWKVLIFLVGMSLLSGYGMLSVGFSMFPTFVLLVALAGGYYWWKSKK
jgi:tetratricopeptide (TPR) repeat protein